MRYIKFICVILIAFAVTLVGGSALPIISASAETEGKAAKTLGVISEGGVAELVSYSTGDERLSDMQLAYEDDKSELYVDGLTAQFALRNKKSQKVIFSSPFDLADASAADETKAKMASVVRVQYYDSNKKLDEMNSFTDAAEKGQITIDKIESGFAANITMGVKETRVLLPSAVPAESFEKNILDKLSEDDQYTMNRSYKLNDIEDYDDDRSEIIKKFPGIVNTPIYVLYDIGENDKLELIQLIKSSGYSFSQMETDLKEVGLSVTQEEAVYCELRVECTLENGDLVVKIPSDTVDYSKDSISLQKIHLLEFFSAAKNDDQGYLFIPDGSGATISFVRGKITGGTIISAPVYGNDAAKSFVASQDGNESMRLPVFGMNNNKGSYFCIIEDGDAAAEISCMSGVMEHSYSSVWCSFNYNAEDDYVHTSGTERFEWTQVDNNPIKGCMMLRYKFLDEEDSDYSGMARTYRKYLLDKGQISLDVSTNKQLPLYIGTLGAIKTQKKVLLFPVTSLTPLTTFDDVELIGKDLMGSGISNINFRLFGIMNGGLQSTTACKADLVNTVGGKKGLEKLVSFADKNAIGIYPDVDFAYCKTEAAFDGFSVSRDAAKMLNGSYAIKYNVDLGTNQPDKNQTSVAIRPERMRRNITSFIDKYGNKTGGLSMGTMGNDLHSDFSKKNPVNRQQSKGIFEDILKTASDKYSVMIDGGNAYSLAYADHILELNSGSNAYIHSSGSVPFTQMVLHGTKTGYAAEPINLSSDKDKALLKAVENGEGLYFMVAMKNSNELLNTVYRDYYSVDYEIWKDTIESMYKKASQVLNRVQGEQMMRHEFLDKDIAKVTYSNGIAIVVNYTDKEYIAGSVIVPAKAFVAI